MIRIVLSPQETRQLQQAPRHRPRMAERCHNVLERVKKVF
jgi:hypothetical protein